MKLLIAMLILLLSLGAFAQQCAKPCDIGEYPTPVNITVCDEGGENCGEELYLCLAPEDGSYKPSVFALFKSTASIDIDRCDDVPSGCYDGMSSWWISNDSNQVEVIDLGWEAYAIFYTPGCYYYGDVVQMFIKDAGTWAIDLPDWTFAGDNVPPGGPPAHVYVTRVDIDADSNNDGQIDIKDEAVEEEAPGRIVVVNSDDDNGNSVSDLNETGPVSNENDLVEVKLSAEPVCVPSGQNGCHVVLRASSGGSNIKVWTTANKGTQIVLPHTYEIGSVPSSVYVEGVGMANPDPDTNTDTASLELVFKKPDGTELCADRVLFTLVWMAAGGNAKLKKLSYIGTDHCDIYGDSHLFEDVSTTPHTFYPPKFYSAPHWEDNSNPLDGDAFDQGDIRYPSSYVRASTLTMSVTIRLQNSNDLLASVLLWGKSPNGFVTYQATATTGGDPLERTASSVTAQQAFPNTVDCFLPLAIHWYVYNGNRWEYVGTSSNNIYITLGKPVDLVECRLESCFDISCKAAKGETTADGTFAAIWYNGGFWDLNGVVNVRGEVLGYYRNRGNCFENCLWTTMNALLVRTNGQCNAWAWLLRDCAWAHNITDAVQVKITPDASELPQDCLPSDVNGFLVNRWEFTNGSGTSGCANYPYKFDACGIYSARWTGGAEVTDIEGVRGQDSPDPLGWFQNHWIVKYNNQYYDPSYGTGPFSGSQNQAELAWEQGAIAGYFGWAAQNSSGQQLLGARKDDPSKREIKFIIGGE